MSRPLLCETLEDRRLLSGVTIVTHGFQSDSFEGTTWLDWMQFEIANRIASLNHGTLNDVAQFKMTITDATVPHVSGWEFGGNFPRTEDPKIFNLRESLGAEAIIVVDWSAIADQDTVSTQIVAGVVANYLMSPDLGDLGKQLLASPIHLIGHSRGASLVGALAEDLGEKGIWVDHVTTLDAHSWSLASDASMTAWEGVVFWDNYWENSHPYPHGQSVPETSDKYLSSLGGGYGSLNGGDHSDVHLWYHGTIDNAGTISDGEVNVFEPDAHSWFAPPNPSRRESGYNFSRVGGVVRDSTGVANSVGGLAARVPIPTLTQAVWPNLLQFRLDAPDVRVPIGGLVRTQYYYEDRDSNATVTFFLDVDKNPFNDNDIPTDQRPADRRADASPWDDAHWIHTDNAQPDHTYFVGAKISDGTRSRYVYAAERLTVNPAQTGTDFSVAGETWTDSSGGDGDGYPETGESILFWPRLRSSADVQNVEAKLTTFTSGYRITDGYIDYGDFDAGQAITPTGRFEIEVQKTIAEPGTDIGVFVINLSYEKTNGFHYVQNLLLTKEFWPAGDHGAFAVSEVTFADLTSDSPSNNGDGHFQSSEKIRLYPRICNNGPVTARGVDVRLVHSGTEIEFFSGAKRYPDLAPGACAVLPDGGYFWVRSRDTRFAGDVYFDVQITYEGASTPVVLPNAIYLVIKPAAVLDVVPRYDDFGRMDPGLDVVRQIQVVNRGSAALTVADVQTSNADTTVATQDCSLPLAPGGVCTISVTIDTEGISNGSLISRDVWIVSPGTRLFDYAAQSDRTTITGLVSGGQPTVIAIPNVTQGWEPDVSGDWIVWSEARYGNGDVFAYNIATGEERQITTNPSDQVGAMISGNLIAWLDYRNWNGQGERVGDVYGFDLATGQEFPISTDPAAEFLIGVDSGRVAFRRRYYEVPLSEPTSNRWFYNLYLYDAATQAAADLTQFTSNTSHNPMHTVPSGDFGGGWLVWNETTYSWFTGSGGSGWIPTNPRVKKMQIGVDAAGVEVLSGVPAADASGTIAVDNGRFVFIAEEAGKPQLWLWQAGGTLRRLTDFTYGIKWAPSALGGQFAVFKPREFAETFYLDVTLPSPVVGVPLTDQTPAYVRMDGRCAVWQGSDGHVYYALIEQPDIAVPPTRLSFANLNPNPLEGDLFDVAAVVVNLTDYAVTDNITVGLYDGDPDAGGVLLGTRVIVGGLGPGLERSVTFGAVNVPNNPGGAAEAAHEIYVRASLPRYDNPGNNTAHRGITVRDNDTDGPAITDVRAVEYQGDGDGVIGTDEQIRISWSLADPAGISAASLFVAGSAVERNGDYYAIVAPLGPGEHTFVISATDGDNSPASSQYEGRLVVAAAERLAVLHEGVEISGGATIDVGQISGVDPETEIDVFLANRGEQRLTITNAAVDVTSGRIEYTAATGAQIAPAAVYLLAFRPDLSLPGPFAATVELATSDAQANPFRFSVQGEVLPAVSIDGVSRTEGDSGSTEFTFTVTLGQANTQGVSVQYATADGSATAGNDYISTSGILRWDAGDTSPRTVTVLVNGDSVVEADETFSVRLSNAGGTTLAVGQATIINDDIPAGTAAVQGTLWKDENANAARDADESPLAGWNVFLDIDQDGQWDAGEPRQATTAGGEYLFAGLAPGRYVVAVELRSGAKQTFPIVSATPLYCPANPARSERDDFGTALAAGESRFLVGVEWYGTDVTHVGIAYLYDGVQGTLLHTLLNPEPSAYDSFGSAVAMSDNALFVGAFVDDRFAADAGAVFQFDATSGVLLRTLPEAAEGPPTAGDMFGHTLAVQGDKLAIGAPQYNRGSGGYVKIYDLSNGSVRMIVNPSGNPADAFGYALAWIGDKLAIGAVQAGGGTGAVYLVDPATGAIQATFLNPSPNVGDAFGGRLAAEGNWLFVSAFYDDTDGLDNGLVYVFDIVTGQHRVLHNPAPAGEGGYFGLGLQARGGQLWVGAIRDDRGAVDSGAAFLFDASTGELLQTYVNPYPAVDDEFGNPLVLVGNRVAIAARKGDAGAGAVYVFPGAGPGVGPGLHVVDVSADQTLNNIDFGIRWSDTQNPLAVDLWPPDDAPGVALETHLAITFSEAIQKGTGDIVLKKSSDNSIVETVAVTSTAVTISGATVTIDLATTLSSSTSYYVEVAAGAVEDLRGNDFAGISGSTAWNFNTNLIVTNFTAAHTGFRVGFSQDLETSVLNLYDSVEQTLGAADVTVAGATVGAVCGSLVVSADQRQITFVPTGGLLEPDTYTVTLFSGVTRFRDTSGGTLDGNADGTTGDDYQTTFTVSALPAGTVTISVPDLARGAGQPVHVPAEASGLPIRLSDAAGVTSLAVDLVYDQDLLTITAATLAAGIPPDWTVTLDTGTAGVAKITASGTTALSGTNLDVVRLTAGVPATAPYGAVQAIRLENVSLNGGAIAAVGDVAVHKAVFLGDVDGSGIHSSADAFLTVQAALGLASGFAAHAWSDPRIVGDADGSGVLSAADAFLIVQEGLGLAEPFVPDNPHIGITPVGGGVDPQFQIDINIPASVGGLVTVPVKLDIEPAATNVGAIDFDLFFDPLQLTIQLPGGVSAGADTDGWAVSATLVAPGHLRVGMVSANVRPLAVGQWEIARLQFHVAASAGSAAFRRLGDDRLKPALQTPGYVVGLDIEPVDPRAGGYRWTAGDGSVAVVQGRPRAAVDERTVAEPLRDRIFGDEHTELLPLEILLRDLADDVGPVCH